MTTEINHGARGHHKYGMSKLNYLDGCAGFVSNTGTNKAAEDGTRLHEVMDKVLKLHLSTVTGVAALDCLKDVLMTEPVSPDEEFYLEYCCKELDFWIKRKPLRILREEQVSILNHDGTELNHGYYDVALFLNEAAVILIDWKFGWIPVPPADRNLQGMGYATGMLQTYAKINTVGFVFAQPKLNKTTRCTFTRAQLPEMYERVKGVIARAESPEKSLRVGQYCNYCAVAGTCTAQINLASRSLAVQEDIQMPTTFTGLQINTPEDAAKALYVVQRLEAMLESSGLKERVKEFARNNGGYLEAQISPSERIIVEIKERAAPRSVDSPNLIAEALKDVLTPEEVLQACDPKITRLEEIFAERYVAQRAAEAQEIIDAAELDILRTPLVGIGAKAARKEAARQAKELRVTKKQACEILASTLSAEGLLTSTEGKVEYLKTRIETDTKQIQHTT